MATTAPNNVSPDLDAFFKEFNWSFVVSNPREVDNPIIYASQNFFEMTGYAPEEILNKNCRFLQGPETSRQAVMEIRDAIREERPTSVCLLNYRKNGEAFWNAFSLTPVFGATGCVDHYIGLQSDVTALVGGPEVDEAAVKAIVQTELDQAALLADGIQRHAEAMHSRCHSSCAASESVSSSLLSALGAISGSFVLSDPNQPDTPMVYCSPAFLALTGYSCEELVGKNCRMLQGPGTDAVAVQQLRDAVAAQTFTTVTLLNYKKDGTSFWNVVHIAPVRDAAGNVQFFCGVQSSLPSNLLSPPKNASATAVEAPPEPTAMQLLGERGTVAAIKVAARSLSVHGLRRDPADQHRPSVDEAPNEG